MQPAENVDHELKRCVRSVLIANGKPLCYWLKCVTVFRYGLFTNRPSIYIVMELWACRYYYYNQLLICPEKWAAALPSTFILTRVCNRIKNGNPCDYDLFWNGLRVANSFQFQIHFFHIKLHPRLAVAWSVLSPYTWYFLILTNLDIHPNPILIMYRMYRVAHYSTFNFPSDHFFCCF